VGKAKRLRYLADITGHTVETQHRRYRHALGRSFDPVRDAIG
jgi:hypothetical protein